MSAIHSPSTENIAPGRLAGIEASRGVAASLVVLYHVARHLDKAHELPLLKSLFQFGHAGVDFFFVISGFIILFVHHDDVGDPSRLARYGKRRFTRLAPTYWVALAVTAALAFMGQHDAPSFTDLVWSASLLPSDRDMVLGVAWTLRYEVVFYALFCVLILNRTTGLVVMVLWLAATLLSALSVYKAPWLPLQFHGAYNLEFFLGMVAAWVVRRRAVPQARAVAMAGFVLFAAAAVLEDVRILDGHGDWGRLAYGVPSALMVLGIAAADRARATRVPALLRGIGAASYSIYLFQFVFIGVVWQFLLATRLEQGLPAIAQFLVLSAAAILGGVLMSAWVEHPLMNLVRGKRPERFVPGRIA